MRSSSSGRGRDQLALVHDGFIIDDLAQHSQSCHLPTVLKRGPLKFVDHVGDTGGVVVSVDDKPGRSSLDLLDLVDVGLRVGVPYCAGVLQNGTDEGLVRSFLEVRGADLEVTPQEAKGLIGLLTDVADM